MRMVGTLLALAILLGIAAIGVQWLTPRIERDVHDRVTASLAEKGLLFADVHVQGREVTLLGDAPTQAARDQAISSAANVFGVARVKDGLAVKGVQSVSAAEVAKALALPEGASVSASPAAKPNGPYTLTIVKQDDNVVLRGMVDSEDSRTVLRRIAATHYGEEHVTDELQVVAGAPEGWRSAAGAALFNIVNLESASVTLSNTEVMVSGSALDEGYNDQAEEGIRKALPTAYKVAFALDVVSVTAPVAAADVEPAAGDDTGTCAKIEDVRMHKVMFGFDKAEITKVYEPTIKAVAETLNGCDQANLEVAGHTDITGSTLYNQWLSEQRAQSGVRALIRNGVAKERLTAKGYGEAKPVGDNKTRSGRAANRRIEFVPSGATSGSGISLFGVDAATATETVSKTAGSWWDRISTAISRAENAVSETVASSTTPTVAVSATAK
jgi:outer membrane protein OmpA-like peptidoglycan-associated protein